MRSCAIFIGLALIWPAVAQDSGGLKIAVVDMTAVFKAHPETAKAEAELSGKRKESREVFKAKSDELKEVLQKHQEVTQKLVEAGSKATSELKTEAKQLLDQAEALEKEVATLKTTHERDLEQGFIAERRRILALISAEIETLNSNGQFALILDKSAASANGIPQVLNSAGATDLTAKLIETVKAAPAK